MRMLRSIATLAVAGLVGLGCSDSTDPDGGGTPIVSSLTCEDPPGEFVECTLVLDNASSFEVELVSSDCIAHNTAVRITDPLQSTLTTDGCYIETGQVWDYPVTWPAGTEIAMEVQSISQALPTAFRVTGAYPNWTLYFEDGGDTDLDDLVLDVRAIE